MIGIQIECKIPNNKPKYRMCRSYKNFDEQSFIDELKDTNWDTYPSETI